MTVATRLRGAIAVYLVLLAGVLVYHVRTNQRAVDRGRTLSAISARVRINANVQFDRVDAMTNFAQKYLVTRDAGYLGRFTALAREYGAELDQMQAVELSFEERGQIGNVVGRWLEVEHAAAKLIVADTASRPAILDGVTRLERALDDVRIETQALGDASQAAMRRELAASERSAKTAKLVAWIAALGAAVLAILISFALVRSIVRPLARLAHGTREISAGRFGHRLVVLARQDDEVAQVSRDFNAMAERLEELDRLKKDFVSTVSHDLKTPLASMQETIDVMLDELPGSLTPKQRQLLMLNQESSRRLSSMLGKLLDLSRVESHTEAKAQVFDVASAVRQVVERETAARDGRANRPLITMVDLYEPLLLHADEGQVRQVVDNLVENAVKFSPVNGVVRVAVAGLADHGQALITVADEGPGVPDSEKERVFERFYQTEAGRNARGRGVGLGLALCERIVASHGGRIWVADREPRGAVFCVLLPGLVAPPAEDATRLAAQLAGASI